MIKSRTIHILVVLLCLLEFGVTTVDAASTEKDNEKTAFDFYESGNRLYHDGQYDEAIRAFEQSIRLESGYYFARNNLGVAMAKKQDFKRALQQFTLCIDKKWGTQADRIVFYFNRALVHQASGQTQSAQKDRAAFKKLDPIRAAELQNVKEYIFMDALYSQRRNEKDRDTFFQENKTAISKGKIIIRKISGHRKNAEEYHAIGLIEGTLDEVSGVLTDYKYYPEFMPNIQEITIRSSTDEGFVIDHKLGLPMGVVKKYRLKYWAKKEPDRIQLFWKKLPWPELKPKETVIDTWGQWILEEYPEEDHHVLAYYRVYTDPGKIPFGMGWIVDILTKESIPNIIKQTRRRVNQMTESTKS